MNRNSDLLFSIICGSRHCLPFIGQCLRSVICQSYSNWEMIVVDDCSADRTYKRACEIAAKHNRITVVQNKKRLHCGGTYKKALSMATGDICGVLDGDDTLPKDAISIILDYYVRYPDIDFIWTNHRWYNTDMSKYRTGISGKPKKGTIYESEEGLRHVYSHWRTFRRELAAKGELFDKSLKCAVDKNLGYSLEELGNGGFLNRPLYHYRYHKVNMSHHSNQRATWKKIRVKHKDIKRFNSVILE